MHSASTWQRSLGRVLKSHYDLGSDRVQMTALGLDPVIRLSLRRDRYEIDSVSDNLEL